MGVVISDAQFEEGTSTHTQQIKLPQSEKGTTKASNNTQQAPVPTHSPDAPSKEKYLRWCVKGIKHKYELDSTFWELGSPTHYIYKEHIINLSG